MLQLLRYVALIRCCTDPRYHRHGRQRKDLKQRAAFRDIGAVSVFYIVSGQGKVKYRPDGATELAGRLLAVRVDALYKAFHGLDERVKERIRQAAIMLPKDI